MKKIPFVKMHGLGNDFVIISEEQLPVRCDIQDLASMIADRRLGVGYDQFIIYNDSQADHVRMRIYNQDGSRARACGNASRCLSRLIFDKHAIENITLDIDGRIVLCKYFSENQIKVDMGPVGFDEDWMPNLAAVWDLAWCHLIEPKEMMCVDVANRHLVIFSKLPDQNRKIIGRNFQNIDLFPDGINVNFATIEDNKIYLKVWERGAQFTYSCGSGAVATFAAANRLGFVGNKAEVVFSIGSLNMHKTAENISMCGPADYVFTGDFIYEEKSRSNYFWMSPEYL